jgi:hypothetical protein
MDFNIILFTGSIGFVCMVIFKLIMKKVLVKSGTDSYDKILSVFSYAMLFVFCIIIYSILLKNIAYTHIPKMHFKLCYAFKAWTVSVSLNAIYEQIFLK